MRHRNEVTLRRWLRGCVPCRSPSAALVVGLVVALASSSLVGCREKAGPGGRFDEAERVTGAASFRLADANVVIRMAPARLLESRAYRDLLAGLESVLLLAGLMQWSPEDMMKRELFIEPSKLSGLFVSMNTLAHEMFVSGVTREEMDQAEHLAAVARECGEELKEFEKHNGVGLHTPEGDTEEGARAFPGGRLFVTGRPPDVRRGIDNHKAGAAVEYRAAMAELLASAPNEADLVIAFVLSPDLREGARKAMRVAGAGLAGPEGFDRFETALVAVEAGDAFKVTLRAKARSAEDGAAARESAAESVRKAKEWAAALAARETMRPLKDLVDTLKVGGADGLVEVSVRVAPDIVKVLEEPTVAGALMEAMTGRAPGRGP